MPGGSDKLVDGELVIIRAGHKKYLKRIQAGKRFTFHRGHIDYEVLIGQPPGVMISSSMHDTLTVHRPTLDDFILNMKRRSGIIYPKDLGIMIMWADIFPGARVLTAGAGSGALTVGLLRTVGREGMVYSYDVRPDMLELTRSNIIEYFGEWPDNVFLGEGDVASHIDQEALDRVVLDVPEPWQALSTVADALQPGGMLACYMPSIVQVQRLGLDLNRMGAFRYAQTFEVMLREWHVDPPSVRPRHESFRHTGFITVAMRVHRLNG